MRGNRLSPPCRSHPSRSIPAYAGEPVPFAGRGLRGGAFRSIPAYAGEPLVRVLRQVCQEVYPRVCGGTQPATLGCAMPVGLSPRMRGNLVFGFRFGQSLWSIPAYAGEPEFEAAIVAGERVYPRVCGGTGTENRIGDLPCGLSPRMRGNPPQWRQARRTARSIPAYAGEPVVGGPASPGGMVYPRVCGGTGGGPAASRARSGLSPRMRGNHLAARRPKIPERSIPAYAGEPRRRFRNAAS